MSLHVEQPAPTVNDQTPIPELVCRDLAQRHHLGAHRHGVRTRIRDRAEHGRDTYGTYLQPHNGRDFGQDLEDELLDACQYGRGWIEEIAAKGDPNLPALRALYEDLLHMACAVRQMRTAP